MLEYRIFMLDNFCWINSLLKLRLERTSRSWSKYSMFMEWLGDFFVNTRTGVEAEKTNDFRVVYLSKDTLI